MKYKILGSFLFFGLIILSSCKKDNIDVTTTKGGPVTPQSLTCSLTTVIVEMPVGMLTVIPNGGTPPYSYNWSTGETANPIFVSSNGTYSVTVTDVNGCVSDSDITLPLPNSCQSFTASVVENPPGVLTVTPNGGTPAYSYLWITGDTTNQITVTTSGNYGVVVADANSCSATAQINVVLQPGLCQSFVAYISDPTPGTFGANTYLGTAPFSYDWSTGETTEKITISANGTYIVTITDANGCVATDEITYPANGCSTHTAQIYENPSGTLTVYASGGILSPGQTYFYHWSTGETTDQILITDAGYYPVFIRDQTQCNYITSIVSKGTMHCNNLYIQITQTSPGVLTANVSNGTPGYSYQWSTGETTHQINASSSGTYSVTVIDANACEVGDFIQL